MAVEFKTEHTRTSEYLFLPSDIKINPELNGRHELPDIEWLISSMVSSGQLQPVLIGNDGGKPVLYAAHSRWRAALEINKRKMTAVPFKLRCVYFKGSEHQAFMATVRENRDRNETTAIDDAFNIAKLERYGMALEDIASTIYHEDIRWVKERLALIELCKEGQQALANQSIKPNAAVALAKLSKDAQREQLKSGKPLTVAAIKRAAAPPAPVSASKPAAKRQSAPVWDVEAFRELLDEFMGTSDTAIRTVLREIVLRLEEAPKKSA